MATVVVVLAPHQPAPALGPELVRELRRLGVTDVSLVDGDRGCGLVLSGWSFDGRRHEQHVLELVGSGGGASVMHGVAEVTLQPDHAVRHSPEHELTPGRTA
jgi:hypothetical protein